MKNTWKKFAALALALCLLISVLPPVASATETETGTETEAAEPTIYNFCLEDDALGLTTTDGGTTGFDGQGITTTAIINRLKALYNGNVINWYHHTRSGNVVSKFGTSTKDSSWDGLIFYNTLTDSHWMSFVLRSPGAGAYNLTLNYQQSSNGTTGKIWILPGTYTTATIPTAMQNNKPLFDNVDCKGTSTTEDYTDEHLTERFAVGSETMLTMVLEVPANGKHINLVSLVAEEAPEVPITFDFFGVEAVHDQALTSSTSDAAKTLNGMYPDQIRWKFWFLDNPYQSIIGGGTRAWSGLQFAVKKYAETNKYPGGFAAFYIKPEQTGNFDVTVHYQTKTGLTDNVEVYLLPWVGSSTVYTTFEAAEPIGTFNSKSTSTTYTDAMKVMDTSVLLKADTEYTVIFYIPNSGTSQLYTVIRGITLTHRDVFAVGENGYGTLEEAAAAAAETQDKLVTLTDDAIVGDYALPDDVTLDLNGHKLESAGVLGAVTANVVDSSDGNNGRLVRTGKSVTFNPHNEDLPVWDYVNKAYSFYDYKLESDTCEPDGDDVTRQKFWFKFHFYTDDDCTTLDQDAYDLVKQGSSGLGISTKLYWNEDYLTTVYFGDPDDNGNNNTDLFARRWATFYEKDEETGEYTDVEIAPHDGRWLYVVVSGLDENYVGTLTVQPEIVVSGVVISSEAMSYPSGS